MGRFGGGRRDGRKRSRRACFRPRILNGAVRMKSELTPRQAEVLEYIKRYIKQYGYAPSMRCIGDRFDIAINAVAGHLRALEAKGWIKRSAGLARALSVLE
jgi:repressor LexA